MTTGQGWLLDRFGAAATTRVAAFVDLVVAENDRQNLVAPSTIATIWERHVQDSAQLLAFDRPGTHWVDIGTGGGFPGVVVALLRDGPVTLVEPRARRAAFLQSCIDRLGLDMTNVSATKVERATIAPAGVISARAVASMDALLRGAAHLAHHDTRWILPRGQSGQAELDALRRSWHGVFHVEHSVVDPASAIVILDKVRTR